MSRNPPASYRVPKSYTILTQNPTEYGMQREHGPDWAAARQRMILDPTVTMLNTGSFGPLPRPVFDRATALRLRLAAGPTDFFVRQAPPLLWESRERTAAFLGCPPERLVFTANVSAAINLVASGLRLAAPGEILISDHEYGAMVWCWERAGQPVGQGLERAPELAKEPCADPLASEHVRSMRRIARRTDRTPVGESAELFQRLRSGCVEIDHEARRAGESHGHRQPPTWPVEADDAAEASPPRQPPGKGARYPVRVGCGNGVPREVPAAAHHDAARFIARHRVPQWLASEGGGQGGEVFDRADALERPGQVHGISAVGTRPP